MRVSCLLPTYGRFYKVCEALTCFLTQDYTNSELVILNNHPVPLEYRHYRVRIINRPEYRTLGDCRNALVAEASGDICCCWNDDDIYLPWHLTECVTILAGNQSYAPMRFWHLDGLNRAVLNVGPMLGAMAFRTDFVRKRHFSRSAGDEHTAIHNELSQMHGGIGRADPGLWSSYCRRWNDGGYHISSTLGRGKVSERVDLWYRMNQDFRHNTPLAPTSIVEPLDVIYAALDNNKTVSAQWRYRVDRAMKSCETVEVEPCTKLVVQEPLLPQQPIRDQEAQVAPARPVIRVRQRQATRSTIIVTTPSPVRW